MKLSEDDLRGLGNLFEGNAHIKALLDEVWEARATKPKTSRKHSHYYKPVTGLPHVDVYRVLQLFNVTDPCLQHAVKKLLVAGGRGGGKDITRDIQEAIDTLARWQEMRREELTSAESQATSEQIEKLIEKGAEAREQSSTKHTYNRLDFCGGCRASSCYLEKP